jgi:hypothetical protein
MVRVLALTFITLVGKKLNKIHEIGRTNGTVLVGTKLKKISQMVR